MPKDAAQEQQSLIEAKLRVPHSVVFRSFPTETVVLNLQTGKYHGLNPTAGRMLQALTDAESVREAAVAVAGEYELSSAAVQEDMCNLCHSLLERGLIEIQDGAVARNGNESG